MAHDTPSTNQKSHDAFHNANTKEVLAEPDVISDPALNDDVEGHDWTSEGGATTDGPATSDAPDPSTDPRKERNFSAPTSPEPNTDPAAKDVFVDVEMLQRDHAHNDAQTLNVASQTDGALTDPRTVFPKIAPPPDTQPEPGLDSALRPKAYRGEHSYVGTGKLRGRKALITGGDSGIGAAVAIAFAREGADVALAYLPVEEDDAVAVGEVITQEGRKAVYLPGDLSDYSYRASLVARAAQELGGLDILVNNAGKQISVDDILELDDDQVRLTFETNILAMFTLSRDAVRIMQPGSTIINTTSIQAYDPSPTLLDYAATKAAINNFTKGLAAQVAPKGIRVNAVAPGPIWTPLQPSHGQPTEKLTSFGHNTWLGRAGQPAEVAHAYVFLAQPESSYIVGETLNVNGGRATP